MSIADKITQLTTIRASMREKLVAKGVDASTHNFADFPNDVESIPSGGTDGYYAPLNMLEAVLPEMIMSLLATGMEYDSSVTYYTKSGTTYTEADMSSYADGDTITDTVYILV